MSSGRCFKDGCTSKLYGKCDCERSVLFCKQHFSEHTKELSFKRHQCIKLYFRPEEEIKQPIIEKLEKLKKDIKICKTFTIMSANEIIKTFNAGLEKYISQVNEIEAKCNKMIKILYSGEKVLDIFTEDDMENVLKFEASNIEKIDGWEINKYYLYFQEIKAATNSIFKTKFRPLRLIRKDDISLYELSYFRNWGANFVTVNLDDFHITSSITLPTQESIHPYAASCILPDKTYFYCYNMGANSGYTFTIDKDKNVKELQNSKWNLHVNPIFYNNFIYLIGGSNKLAERYDFKQNIWESMAPITQNLNFDYGCNVLYKDLILLIGRYIKKILIYSIPQNNYQDAQNLVLNAKCYKLMLTGNNRVYVFEKQGRTFESAESNISSWTQIGSNSIPNDFNRSSVIRYKGCFYFVIANNELWEFDLSSKQASKVANV